jgi:formamidopyrimidine-DNA glycosylase
LPELPEVETVARALRDGAGPGAPPLAGRSIVEARVLWKREINGLSARTFEQRVAGWRVASIGRHGKYLILELTTDPRQQTTDNRPQAVGSRRSSVVRRQHAAMLVHLKMSGRLEVVPQTEALTPHARVVWWLDGGWALRFEDARKFGRVYLVDDAAQITGRLGPDALAVDAGAFADRLARKRGALKPILLDQTFVAGVGNIYADEALHLARLHPKRLAGTLAAADARRLHAAVRQVLLGGIAANGASFDWVYPGGNYQDNFKVYGRAGEPCPECGRPIARILVGQRSTHFCERCQR